MGGTYYAEAEKVSRPAVRCADCTARAPLASWQCRVTFDVAQAVAMPSWENLTSIIRPMIESVCSDGNSDAARLGKDIADAILAAQPPAAPVEIDVLSRLVDWTYLHATEGETWPSSKTKADLITRARQDAPRQEHADGMKAVAPAQCSAEIGVPQTEGELAHMINHVQNRTDARDLAKYLWPRMNTVPQPLSVWHPIETAPKDGTPIEACNTRHPSHAPVIVRWDDDGLSDDVPEPHWCDAATRDGEALYYNQNYFDFWKPTTALPRPVSR